LSVAVLDNDTLNIDRSSYNGMYSDRKTSLRNALYSCPVEVNLAQKKLVIVDSLNYIKGFRYQMYCAARGIKVCVCTMSF
ncbi:hypothetical protein M404DRAFT_148529, partial [Pisolithus tinctorius Marx 270]